MKPVSISLLPLWHTHAGQIAALGHDKIGAQSGHRVPAKTIKAVLALWPSCVKTCLATACILDPNGYDPEKSEAVNCTTVEAVYLVNR